VCGIVGYVGSRAADAVLLKGLRRLEYRGYDSAGIATIADGNIDIRRAVGKLDNLEQALEHLAQMGVKPDRKFIGRAKQRIAFVSDPDGNSIELMEIPPESEIYRTYP